MLTQKTANLANTSRTELPRSRSAPSSPSAKTVLCGALLLLISACGDGASRSTTEGQGTSGAGGSSGDGLGGGGGVGGGQEEAAWDAIAEVEGTMAFLFDGPDDGVWLVTFSDAAGLAYGEVDYDVTLLGPDLASKCTAHFDDPARNDDAWLVPAIDPDGNLVLVKGDGRSTEVTRLDARCGETPWLVLDDLDCYGDSTGGTVPRHAVATRDAVFLGCGFGDLPDPVVATETGVEHLTLAGELGRVRMIRSASGDEVLLVDEEWGRTLRIDGTTGVVLDETAFEAQNGTDGEFHSFTRAASLIRTGDGYAAVAHRVVTDIIGDFGETAEHHDDEVVSLLPDRSVGELQPWLGVTTSSPAPTPFASSFLASRDHIAFVDDTWLSWGVAATAGLGDYGILAKSTATLRAVDREGAARYAPLPGIGRSAPVAMTRTASGAMVVAFAYEQALTLGDRRFDSGKLILARSEHPERLGGASDVPAQGCKLLEEACVRCVDQNRTDRCFSDDYECVSLLLSAQGCACSAQLDAADIATVGVCFDPIDQLTDGHVTTDVFRTTCRAECL